MASPLSSLFIAAYIVQFLDLASSTTTNARAAYKSTSFAPPSRTETQSVSKRLQELASRLKTPDVPSGPGPFGSLNRCARDFRLTEICRDCREVQVRLRPYVGEVKKDGPAGAGGQGEAGKWGKFKKALRTAGSKQELDDIAKKLGDLRDQNDWHILALLRKMEGPGVILDDESFKTLDPTLRMIISGWLEQKEVAWSMKGKQEPEGSFLLLNW